MATIWAVMLTKRTQMGCKLLEIMADGMYVVFHRIKAFLKKRLTHKQ